MSDTIKGVKIKELPEKDAMTDTDILVVEDSEATKQISAEAMKTYFTADLADEIQKLKDENAELSDNLYKSVEFYNGDEWLETVVVMRGDDATYTGDTPQSPDGDDYVFTGWSPEPVTVKNNIKCYAQYKYDPVIDGVAFAVYSETDNSLTFYCDVVPEEGNIYNDKIVTNVYTEFEDFLPSTSRAVRWYAIRENVFTVNFDESFSVVKPKYTMFWFDNFSNCTNINGLNYLDTSLNTNMDSMFRECTSLTELDVSGFNTNLVTGMSYMFYRCKGLTKLDVSNFNTSLIKNMTYMFRECTSLTELDVSGFDTSSVTIMNSMFYSCSNLATIYSDDNNFVVTKVTDSSAMFNSCSKLVGGNGTMYIYGSSATDASMAHIDTADNPGYFTAK